MQRRRSTALMAATLLAGMFGAAAASAAATPQPPPSPAPGTYPTLTTFEIKNRSGLTPQQALFYYLAFGTNNLTGDLMVMTQRPGDGGQTIVEWKTAGSSGTNWNDNGGNQTGSDGAGVIPCFPLNTNVTPAGPPSIITIPANISGRFYVFQVNKGSPLFGTPCDAAPSEVPKQFNGIFGNYNTSTGGYAPFGYLGNGAMTGPAPNWLARQVIPGSSRLSMMPIWTYGEIGSDSSKATIDTSQVDFIGLAMNVTAQMTSLGTTFPVWNQGVGFSFSPNGQVNMNAVKTSYTNFVKTLPVTIRSGRYKTSPQADFGALMHKFGTSTVLFNPGNYIPYVDNSAFAKYFLNLINNYMWYPGARSVGGLPSVVPWSGRIDTGGMIPAHHGLPQVTFTGKAIALPAPGKPQAYPGYTAATLPRGQKIKTLYAIEFSAPIPGTSDTAVAYVLSPASYQVLCKANVVTAGCYSPAYQVFAADGALANPNTTPQQKGQFALLTDAQQAVWTTYGGTEAYNLVVARLGVIISSAFNRGVAGGLTTPGGLCAGTTTMNECWNNQAFWYPTPKTASERRKFFQGDTSQNHFSRWLHTAQLPLTKTAKCSNLPNSNCVPMMTQPVNPVTLSSGAVMGMGYGFSNDEDPDPPLAGTALTPSKYDGIVAPLAYPPPSPYPGCNYITIMPWQGGSPNTTPVTATGCDPGIPLN